MAAPSTYAQLELGSTTYTSLVELLWTPGTPQYIVHPCPSSVAHPAKFYGRGPAQLEGVMQMAGSSVVAFMAALQTETIRHASWMGPNAVAVYCHVYAAEITEYAYVAGAYGAPANTKLVRVGFRFVCPDQRLYLYSDNSVLVGA
ncbi:MAG: hypothetical protein PHS80_11980 [Methanothrix sp.]|nr:hypothetical protein [Methanothrix sp.]